jgi:uncharacterized protein YjiS (DUF1127 family)
MSNRQRANRPLRAFIAELAQLVHDKMIDPMRRHALSRGGERELARLDDRMLRDIGLTRSQVHAAAFGLIRLGEQSRVRSSRASRAGSDDVRPKRSAVVLSVDGATATPVAERAARG